MIRNLTLAGLGWALVLSAAGAAQGQTRADIIPLGRSATSGAVCQAYRDYEDPVVQAAGRRAWTVRCRGWEGALGRLYALDKTVDASPWTKALAERAACNEVRPQALSGLSGANRRACNAAGAKSPYVAYDARKGASIYAAEGAAQIADVLETGLRVVAGAAKPPKLAEVQTSAASAEIAADFGGATGGLARAQAAAAADPARLRARAYVQNNEWRFDQAETDFQALVVDAEARGAPPREMAEAILNLALNVSNNGRFAEAEKLFADADVQVRASRDPLLAVQADTYRALHLRNAGRFADAVITARRALQVQQQARAAAGATSEKPQAIATGDGVAIGAELSHALNVRAGGRDMMATATVSTGDRLAIQEAQALEVIGSSLAAQGDGAGARGALDRATQMLAAAEANGAINDWLRARVEADIAELDLAAGRAGPAADRLAGSVQVIRRRHAGSAAEGGMLLELGAAQVAAGREDAALTSFGRAFTLFQQQRGALGASADQAAPYFDLLIKRIDSDPARADEYRSRFFAAAESVVSNATAQTVSNLAARVASGDGAITGLVRALEDTRRERRATEARAAALQQDGAYTGEERSAIAAQLLALQQQSETLEAELLAANPRYAQLVSSEARLADLQKSLRPDEVFAKILLLGPKSYGMLVTRTTAKPYAVSLTRYEVAAAVQQLRRPFEAEDTLPAFDVAKSYDLFQKLFAPVAGELLAAKHFIYEPDGPLISLPVATLVSADPAALLAGQKEADYRKVAWLGARLDSSLVLSAASFMQSRSFNPSKAKQNFLAFADPASPNRADDKAYASVLKRGMRRGGSLDLSKVCQSTRDALLGLPSLPDTADEVRQVGASIGGGRPAASEALITGSSFTDESVKGRADLSDYKVLYFATHGLLPQPSACLPEPALVTSVGTTADSDGLLDASEILDLKLDADLVVLSACDTGGAGGGDTSETGLQGGGEALGGLARAVIYAGGRSLIVSHWSVDSAATVRLMTGLFSAQSPSEAESLQRAQIALQNSEQWSHPYFWAPFTIVGDGARAMPTASRASAD